MAKGPDHIGARFGRLTVIGRAESDKNGNSRWHCVCDCGNKSTPLGQSLRSGVTVSCGCYAVEVNRARTTTHGVSSTAAYKAWHGMIQRCTNPSHHKWPRYGGRGIKVCEQWLTYEGFVADMGARPDGMTIDRINNDGNYEPGNCRWATQLTQGNNRGNNRVVEIGGESLTMSEAVRKAGLNLSTVRWRLRNGWPIEKAITQQPQN